MIDSQAQDRGRVCSMSLIKRLPEKKNGMRLIPDAKKKKGRKLWSDTLRIVINVIVSCLRRLWLGSARAEA